MEVNLETFAGKIFDALQEFDRSVQPFGLYSARDIALQPNSPKIVGLFQSQVAVREDLRGIKKFCDDLTRVGRWASSNTPHFFFEVPDFGSVSLQMARVAKIKVRQYGSSYHLDNHLNYENRWEQLELDKEILRLRYQRAQNSWQMVLLLGFDKAQRPFERELTDLKTHRERAKHGIEYFERVWDDSIGRGFKIKAALWARDQEKEAI